MIKLTPREKEVLYGLVRWPELTDVQLSEEIGVKRSTVNSIKNKLLKKKLYDVIRVPNLQQIGCELLAVFYEDFNVLKPYEVRKKYLPSKKFDNVFFVLTSDERHVRLLADKNLTEIKKYSDYMSSVYGVHNFLGEEGSRQVFFPFELTKIFRFFDFAPLLAQHVGIVDKPREEPFLKSPGAPVQFTGVEKRVYYNLIKYPGLNDSGIAGKASVTRQSVSNMRKKFINENLLKTVCIPDLEKLGFELVVFRHSFFNPRSPVSRRVRTILRSSMSPHRVLLISGNIETTVLSVYRNYTEFQHEHTEYMSTYKKMDFLAKEPLVRIFPLAEIRGWTVGRYAPLVKKVLDVKV